MTRDAIAFVALAASALVACGAGTRAPSQSAAPSAPPLAVRAVAWNGAGAAIGGVRAVADAGDVVAVCGEGGAVVLASRAVVRTDASLRGCASAAAIPGADGAASWVVVVDGAGRVHRVRDARAFEDVSARYGLGDVAVREAAPLGQGRAGFRLDAGIAIADGAAVARYALGPFAEVAGGASLAAGVEADGVRLVDGAHRTSTLFPLRGATHAAIDAKGRLYATTERALYAVDDRGALARVLESSAGLHGLVASGDAVWFADGAELGVVDGARATETRGAGIAPDASLVASPSGDVWVIAGGALTRFARATPDAAWTTTLAPIFARACAACHLPGGVSGTDLSTAAAWSAERDAIGQRVIAARSMPPEGHPLSDADREAIRAWLEGGR